MKLVATILAVIACVSAGLSAQDSNRNAPDRPDKQITSLIAPPANPTITSEPKSEALESLAAARVIFVSSECSEVDPSTVRAAFLNHRRFHEYDLQLTLDPDKADVFFEITAAEGRTKLKYIAVDRRSKLVVTSGDVFSLFGEAIEDATANFLATVKRARHIP